MSAQKTLPINKKSPMIELVFNRLLIKKNKLKLRYHEGR
jgi:hypothetical protein